MNSKNNISGFTLAAGILGLIAGLVISALVSIPISNLPGWMGSILPFFIYALLGLIGLLLGISKGKNIRNFMQSSFNTNQLSSRSNFSSSILVDTSAIIDGRISDIVATGFIDRELLIPRFVLDELRHISDSPDAIRRNKGRRGLDVLSDLQNSNKIQMQILDVGVNYTNEVDSELIQLAKNMNACIFTTDYNLNRVAELQGIPVLNVNELANAVKSIVIPGEEINVNIVQEGKEIGQGVAYLDDGTMVVVEGGRRFINSSHDVTVTRVLQTAAGRIIFAQTRSA
ncbi:MAG: PIN domain nuclease [SAR202 cluster bacterium]|nr:PIN domain nuclease [SAR202 cluster bacterium]MQG52869.1 PIN domain nuclease [SAR202 cluster bacterium]|tara:strand:- start:2409 stop:3263 length:855 start_codon:yes stop_codon:yes gene_type:complete